MSAETSCWTEGNPQGLALFFYPNCGLSAQSSVFSRIASCWFSRSPCCAPQPVGASCFDGWKGSNYFANMALLFQSMESPEFLSYTQYYPAQQRAVGSGSALHPIFFYDKLSLQIYCIKGSLFSQIRSSGNNHLAFFSPLPSFLGLFEQNSGKCHSVPGLQLRSSYNYFRDCILSTKSFWLPFCFKSTKNSSIAFIATLRVETGQITQLQPNFLKSFTSIQGVCPNSVMFASRNILGLCFLSYFATSSNYSAVQSPSGKIISAPASIYAFDLLMQASSPSTLLASVLAQTTNYPSDTFKLVALAMLTFFFISSTEISSLPNKWPHLLGKT